MKKQSFQVFVTFLFLAFLLLSYSSTSAAAGRGLAAEGKGTLNEVKEDLHNLMGSETELAEAEAEVCEEKDEECLNRRMTADAHLDYIYTQNHKP